MPLTLSSPAFTHGGEIPPKYTCEGDDVSPSLTWSGVPDGTRSFALIVDDPDAPDPEHPKQTYVHWVLYNLPPLTHGIAEGGPPPAGTLDGINDWKRTGYGGPCPPIGRHRYFFKLYALNDILPNLGAINKAGVEKAMEGHIVAQAELMGTYQKTR